MISLNYSWVTDFRMAEKAAPVKGGKTTGTQGTRGLLMSQMKHQSYCQVEAHRTRGLTIVYQIDAPILLASSENQLPGRSQDTGQGRNKHETQKEQNTNAVLKHKSSLLNNKNYITTG